MYMHQVVSRGRKSKISSRCLLSAGKNMIKALSQRVFPKWQLPKYTIFPKRQLPKSVLAAAIGPNHVVAAARGTLTHPSRSDRPPLQPQRA